MVRPKNLLNRILVVVLIHAFSPGRFFAISEVKCILAHILLNYDVQLENGSLERPPNFILETSTIPSAKTKVMFRKIRKTSDV